MLRDVQICAPVFRRDGVDSRRNPVLFCLRPRPKLCILHGAPPRCEPAPRGPDWKVDCRGPLPWAMKFSRYLEKRNREVPELTPVRHEPEAPHAREPRHKRPDVPRLGDIPPVERIVLEQRIRVVYRIEVPLKAGRVIDVLM